MRKPKKLPDTEEMREFQKGKYDSAGDDWPEPIWTDEDYQKWKENKENKS